MKIIFKSVLLSFLIISAYSCRYATEESLLPCDTVSVSYALDVVPILQNNCFRCHGENVFNTQGGGRRLEGYDHLKSLIDQGKVLGNIKHSPGFIPMPMGGGKLNECDIAIIESWIKNGYPNN